MIGATALNSGPFFAAPDMAGWTAAVPLVAGLWRELQRGLFDSYRPERHYMRGPGPRWRERHPAEPNLSIAGGRAFDGAGR